MNLMWMFLSLTLSMMALAAGLSAQTAEKTKIRVHVISVDTEDLSDKPTTSDCKAIPCNQSQRFRT